MNSAEDKIVGSSIYRKTIILFSSLRMISFSLPLFPLFLLFGCANTELSISSFDEQLPFQSSALKPLPVRTLIHGSEDIVGRQYAVMFLPLGRIRVPEVEKSFNESLNLAAAINGFQISSTPDSSVVVLKSLSINAYDFLVMRKLTCTIELDVNSKLLGNRPVKVSEVRWNKYGFKPQLEDLLFRCMRNAAHKVVEDLIVDNEGSFSPFKKH